QQIDVVDGPPARWVSLIGGDGTIARHPLGRRLRIGSGTDVDVNVADPLVSRTHCELEPTVGGVVLRDLGSTNGTRAGGAAVRGVVLTPGAVAMIGSTRLFVETDAPVHDLVRFGSAVTASAAMASVFTMLDKLAPSDVTILLTGETGTGKD